MQQRQQYLQKTPAVCSFRFLGSLLSDSEHASFVCNAAAQCFVGAKGGATAGAGEDNKFYRHRQPHPAIRRGMDCFMGVLCCVSVMVVAFVRCLFPFLLLRPGPRVYRDDLYDMLTSLEDVVSVFPSLGWLMDGVSDGCISV